MRVLVVTPWFPSRRSPGSGIFNLRDVRMLAAEQDVTVAHLIDPSTLDAVEPAVEGIRIVRVPFSLEKPMTVVRAVRAIRQLLSAADLVHTMAFPALVPTRLARPKIPWVHTEHYGQLIRKPATCRMCIAIRVLKRFLRSPDEVVAVSQTLADAVNRNRQSKAWVIPNGVMFPEEGVASKAVLYSRASGSPRIISVGNLIDSKGPIHALRALIELRARGLDAQLTWAGTGVLADTLVREASTHGVTDSLHLAGHLSPDELSHALLSANVFMLPVETETFGVAMAEALAHGLPVVTSGTGGHLEFLPPEASRVVEERDAASLATAVVELLAPTAPWDRNAIHTYARSRFSEDERRELYQRVYGEALAVKLTGRDRLSV